MRASAVSDGLGGLLRPPLGEGERLGGERLGGERLCGERLGGERLGGEPRGGEERGGSAESGGATCRIADGPGDLSPRAGASRASCSVRGRVRVSCRLG